MNASFGQCSLYLHPENHKTLKTSVLISELEKIGLIAKPLIAKQMKDKHFYTGENYLDYIAYMGCAPNLQFKASGDNKNFCFIKVHSYDRKQLIVSKTQARPPLCPECKKPVKNWEEKITDRTLFCENCNKTAGIEGYDWRKMGGFAQLFIEITDVFPKEAVPQPSLLDKLSKITQTKWQFFYSCR